MTYILGGVLPYVALLALVVGVAYRYLGWARKPRHLKWALYPHPRGPREQARFMAGEIFTFHALLRRNRALWAGAFLFHVSLAACAVGLVLFTAAATGPQIAVAGLAGLFACSAYLVLYRLGKRTARKISTPVEFANLGLFLVLSGAGLLYALTSAGGAEPVRVWLRGLTTLHPGTIPTEAGFPIALLATEVFLVYFPFSRMIHMVSKWFAFHKVNWE